MNELMVRNLIGEDDFMALLIGMPDLFFNLPKGTQEAFWNTVLVSINDGVREVEKLIELGKTWLGIYQRIKTVVHGFGYGIN